MSSTRGLYGDVPDRARSADREAPAGDDALRARMPGRSVLFVGNFLSRTIGGWSFCESLAEQLTAAGWKVITTSSKRAALPRLAAMMRTVWSRRREYSVAHVDVYSGRAFVWAEAVTWLLRLVGKPYVLTLHGGDLPSFARRWPARVIRVSRGAAAVTAPSEYLREAMTPFRTDIRLLPNAVDLGACRFRPRESVSPRIVWVRAFHEIYNPSLAPKVLGLLAPEFPDVRLTMFGRDKGDGSLEQVWSLARELGVADRLEVPGALEKARVPERLNDGDIFLNTTNVENTPVSVLEALACGLCVVSTNVGGIPYLLRHEENALLVPPDDPESMAAAVRRVLREPGLALRLSRNGRRKAEECDWSVLRPCWESLLETPEKDGR